MTDDQVAHGKTLTGIALRDCVPRLMMMLVGECRNAALMR